MRIKSKSVLYVEKAAVAGGPLQSENATGRGQRSAASPCINSDQQFSTRCGQFLADLVQHSPKLGLQRHRGGVAGQKNRTFDQITQRTPTMATLTARERPSKHNGAGDAVIKRA